MRKAVIFVTDRKVFEAVQGITRCYKQRFLRVRRLNLPTVANHT